MTQEERFWNKVAKMESGCWEWRGRIVRGGYGQFYYNGKIQSAHRASWQICNGDIPEGICVLHRCDNRKCVNPEHLFLGSYQDNTSDRISKGRSAKGEDHGRSVLSDEDVDCIRSVYANGGASTRQLAKDFGTSKSNIWCIVRNQSWRML